MPALIPRTFVRVLALAALLPVLAAMAPALAAEAAAPERTLPAYAQQFDASRDPVADLRVAREAAAAAGHNVLVIVGGDWCVWCYLLDRHLRQDPAAAEVLYGGFEVLRVYYGDDNKNGAFLAPFPAFETFPHFFVVAPDGKVLDSRTADGFIRDAKYDTAQLRAFTRTWTPPAR